MTLREHCKDQKKLKAHKLLDAVRDGKIVPKWKVLEALRILGEPTWL